jgi:endonuclease/exonuclease/phosphatase family metal-dependent hydrolase
MSSTATADPIHGLRPHFSKLVQFQSREELESSPLYQALRPEIDQTLNTVLTGAGTPMSAPVSESIGVRALAWNIERGIRVDGVIRAIRERPELAADVLMLTELDLGMARTQNRFVARDIADALGLNYAFAPCYLALNKGNGIEKNAAGENEESLHGNALFSRYPLDRVHSFAIPNGKDKMKGVEKRIGSQRAVIADIRHPSGTFRAVSLHLDALSSQSHRHLQMKLLFDHLEGLTPALPTLIGGDWNTTTHDASQALYSILGYFRRVLMGIRHMVRDHYPYPDRWFERRLFREVEQRGYDYRSLNVPGECTLHYSMDDVAANLNMGEWVPGWCFQFIRWALGQTGGRCSLKLDWFAGKGIRGQGASVIHGIEDEGRPVSDHDPIVLGFVI